MLSEITTLRLRDLEFFTTDYDTDEWLTYDFINKSNWTKDIFLQWICDEKRLVKHQTTFYSLMGKRCVDIIVSSFVIVFILSWLIPVIATLIYLDSSGPFYFIQLRTGLKGKPFSCLKFRTMIHNLKETEFQQTLKNDSRVTSVGQFLRRTNLDEMLQFVNVFLGHMTLVGPRPHAIAHDTIYWASNNYRTRYAVKPGITGLAQIRGARGATTHSQLMNDRVRYDRFYINKQTFILDIKICIDTILMSFRGDAKAW